MRKPWALLLRGPPRWATGATPGAGSKGEMLLGGAGAAPELPGAGPDWSHTIFLIWGLAGGHEIKIRIKVNLDFNNYVWGHHTRTYAS